VVSVPRRSGRMERHQRRGGNKAQLTKQGVELKAGGVEKLSNTKK